MLTINAKLNKRPQLATLTKTKKLARAVPIDETLPAGIRAEDMDVRGLMLAPSVFAKVRGLDGKLLSTCGHEGVCSHGCSLWFTGRLHTPAVRAAMIRRTQAYFADPAAFTERLYQHLARWVDRAALAGTVPIYRPNIGSDRDFSELLARLPKLAAYDYTKYADRVRRLLDGDWPQNYWLTFSFSEKSHWGHHAAPILRRGGNVCVVTEVPYRPLAAEQLPLPKVWRGWPTVDGDVHDIRRPEFDGRGVVVLLRFRGNADRRRHATARGFAKRLSEGNR